MKNSFKIYQERSLSSQKVKDMLPVLPSHVLEYKKWRCNPKSYFAAKKCVMSIDSPSRLKRKPRSTHTEPISNVMEASVQSRKSNQPLIKRFESNFVSRVDSLINNHKKGDIPDEEHVRFRNTSKRRTIFDKIYLESWKVDVIGFLLKLLHISFQLPIFAFWILYSLVTFIIKKDS